MEFKSPTTRSKLEMAKIVLSIHLRAQKKDHQKGYFHYKKE